MGRFDNYIAPAGARVGLWRPLLGLIIALAVWVTGIVLLVLGVAIMRILSGQEAEIDSISALAGGGSPEATAFILASFWGIWAGLALALWLCHRQRFGTLIAPERRVRWREARLGLYIALAIFGLSILPAFVIEGAPRRTELPLGDWAFWLLIFIPLIWVQAGAEELLFRGYLVQQIAIRLRHPLLWAVPPAALFGVLHYNPGLPGSAGLLYALATFCIGLSTAVMTYRTGSLSAAMGFHFGINILGVTVVGAEGLIEGSQLFVYNAEAALNLLGIDNIAHFLLLAWLLSPWSPFRRGLDASA